MNLVNNRRLLGLLPLLSLCPGLCSHAGAQVWEADPLVAQALEANVGFVVASAGDVDGDGLEDALITNIAAAANRGRMFVVSSSGSGTLLTLTGVLAGDNLGHSAASLGDVDGDGLSDVVASAPVLGGSRPGSVTLYSGANGQPIWTRTGEANGDFFGWVVACAGDVNGDGVQDLAVGAPGHDQPQVNAGKAYVLSGIDGTVIHSWLGIEGGDSLGSSVGSAGDRDLDGHSEVLLCAVRGGPGDAGQAYVHAGIDGALLCTLDSLPNGNQYGNYFGGLAGDIDADGIPDVYVIDYLHVGQRGRMYVYSGADCSLIHSFRGPVGSSFLFGRVQVGDLDGDGYDDLLLCSAGNDTGGNDAGAVYLYSGASGELMGQFNGDEAGLLMGTDCASLGDLDGDGFADILVGVGDVDGGEGGLFLLPTMPAPPQVVCSSEANSSGEPASTGYQGPLSLAAGAFEILVDDGPGLEQGILFGGPLLGPLPLGDGVLCLAQPLTRLETFIFDSQGATSISPNLTSGGPVSVMIGVPWHFQAWFRDPAPGASGFNFSDALRVTFRL